MVVREDDPILPDDDPRAEAANGSSGMSTFTTLTAVMVTTAGRTSSAASAKALLRARAVSRSEGDAGLAHAEDPRMDGLVTGESQDARVIPRIKVR
jgi:hypothetical protein